MEIKDLQSLHQAMQSMDLQKPPIILVSGKDLSVFELIVQRARELLSKTGSGYESTVFTGEPGDEGRFHEEVFNIPLFIPTRLIVVHRADQVLKHMTESQKSVDRYQEEFAHLPDSTLILLEYEGKVPAGLLKIFTERILHYSTKELYADKLQDAIEQAARRLHLELTGEAIHEIMERITPGAGNVDNAINRLANLLPEQKQGQATGEDIRELLFPAPGMNVFLFVDALFEGKRSRAIRELEKLNPAVDSFFPVLTIMLSRVNEIRMARTGFSHGYTDQELIEVLGKKNLHPFIQKKTISRLKSEIHAFDNAMIERLYQGLIDLRFEFQRNVPPGQQELLFQARLFPLFFGSDADHYHDSASRR